MHLSLESNQDSTKKKKSLDKRNKEDMKQEATDHHSLNSLCLSTSSFSFQFDPKNCERTTADGRTNARAGQERIESALH